MNKQQNNIRHSIYSFANHIKRQSKRMLAHFWANAYKVINVITFIWRKHGTSILTLLLVVLIGISIFFRANLQHSIEGTIKHASLAELFSVIGGSLIGATAIAFSLIMFSLQTNIERMPYGLFRHVSTDIRMISAFAGTLFLAILVACASLMPDISWASTLCIAVFWSIIFTLLLFVYAYRRALQLINPIFQLNLLVTNATASMERLTKSINRIKPLFKEEDDEISTVDEVRLKIFTVNPRWKNDATSGIRHASSFARQYSQHGDHEVSGAALSAVVRINLAYIKARGKTIFSSTPLLDSDLSSDPLVNETLEFLRQNVRIGISRGDEEQIEQTFRTFVQLVEVYSFIDYAGTSTSLSHAQLAAAYLSNSVQTVIPHDMADVLMEGVNQIGQAGQILLKYGSANEIAILTDKLGVIGSACIVNEKYHPVSRMAVQQLATLTFSLLGSNSREIGFWINDVRKNIKLIAEVALKYPDNKLLSKHSTIMAPYYGGLGIHSMLHLLTTLGNTICNSNSDNEPAKQIIENMTEWSANLFETEKTLLLDAILTHSFLAIDIIQWIKQVTEILLAVSTAPACNDHNKTELQHNARHLTDVLSWIPLDNDTIQFIESFSFTDLLFEIALSSHHYGNHAIEDSLTKQLTHWTFEAGKHTNGWNILVKGIIALAVLALTRGGNKPDFLKHSLAEYISKWDTPDITIIDRAANELFHMAEHVPIRQFPTTAIDAQIKTLDLGEFSILLTEIAALLLIKIAK